MAFDILKLLDQLTPEVRDAFLRSVADLKSQAQVNLIIASLQRGDIDSALRAMNIRPEFFAPLDDALRAAYLQGGMEALAALPRLPDPFREGAWSHGSTAETHAPKSGLPKPPRD